MDNLTHSLVGLAAAKAGLERLSPFATTVCVIAANAPDFDIVMSLGGHWTYLKHHRGLTHSILGTLMLAVALPLLFYAGEYLSARVRRCDSRIRFKGLLLASLILSVSHPLLDWTNDYGVRPLLPWSGQWFYGDLVFIVDPWLILSLGGAAFLLTAQTKARLLAWAMLALLLTTIIFVLPVRSGLPYPLASRALWVLGLVGLGVAHRFNFAARWNGSLAATTLALIVVYWSVLGIIHHRALAEAEVVSEQVSNTRGEILSQVAAMPVLANPLRWQCLAVTNRATYQFDVVVNEREIHSEQAGNVLRYEKPTGALEAIVNEAAQDARAKVFLDFARFPAVRVERNCATETLVRFADLRYTEPGGNRPGGFSLDVPVSAK